MIRRVNTMQTRIHPSALILHSFDDRSPRQRTYARRDRPHHHDGLGGSHELRRDPYPVRSFTRRRHQADAIRDDGELVQNVAKANARPNDQARSQVCKNRLWQRATSVPSQVAAWLMEGGGMKAEYSLFKFILHPSAFILSTHRTQARTDSRTFA